MTQCSGGAAWLRAMHHPNLPHGRGTRPGASHFAAAFGAGMDAMITMLPGPSAVEEVYCGAGGVLSAAGGVRARLMLDCSTIDPPTARRVAEAAEASPLHPEACAVAASWHIGGGSGGCT